MPPEKYRIGNENEKFKTIGENTMVKVAVTADIPLVEERAESIAKQVIYQGWAAVGSAEDETVWVISKITWSGDDFVSRTWANAEDTFDKVWDDRATYNYSY